MPQYPAAGLKHGIERCLHNIDVLKAAIQKERETIKQYERWIRDAEENAKKVAQRDAFVAANQRGLSS